MPAFLANLTPKVRMLLAVPAVVVAYMLVMNLIPAMFHAMVPEVVRSVLRLL